jgi:hypothetical protein
VIEDITGGDDFAAGIQWHVECGDGVFFPFSRGCSFVRLNADGKIVSVRRGGGGGRADICLGLRAGAGAERAARVPRGAQRAAQRGARSSPP